MASRTGRSSTPKTDAERSSSSGTRLRTSRRAARTQTSETLPTVIGSTFASWKDFRECTGRRTGFTSPTIRFEGSPRTSRTQEDAEEKVRAIFEYVADDIRYVNYVSGEWWLPNRPQQLLAAARETATTRPSCSSRCSRPSDRRHRGAATDRYTAQPSVLSSTKAAVPLFDHGIAYLPGRSGAPGSGSTRRARESDRPVPSMDARAQALFLTGGPPVMVPTRPVIPTSTAWMALDDQARRRRCGRPRATERHMGDHAFVLRTSLREKDARAVVEQTWSRGVSDRARRDRRGFTATFRAARPRCTTGPRPTV